MEVHATDTIEYDSEMGIVLANIICTLNERQNNREVGVQNVVTHTLNQAMKKWGERASQEALKEMKQLLDRKCFVPIDAASLSKQE